MHEITCDCGSAREQRVFKAVAGLVNFSLLAGTSKILKLHIVPKCECSCFGYFSEFRLSHKATSAKELFG